MAKKLPLPKGMLPLPKGMEKPADDIIDLDDEEEEIDDVEEEVSSTNFAYFFITAFRNKKCRSSFNKEAQRSKTDYHLDLSKIFVLGLDLDS